MVDSPLRERDLMAAARYKVISYYLCRHTLARVGKKLDALDQKRGKTKFSDNFNYALKS